MEPPPTLVSDLSDLRQHAFTPVPLIPGTSVILHLRVGENARSWKNLSPVEIVATYIDAVNDDGEHSRRLVGEAANAFIAYAKLLHLPREQAIEQWEFIQKATNIFTERVIPEDYVSHSKKEFLLAKKVVEDEIIAKLTELAKAVIQTRCQQNNHRNDRS